MRAFVAAFLFCAHASATTIVAIWTPQKLVISGDSLVNVNWTGEDGLHRHTTAINCKIRKYGAFYVAAAGNYRIQTAGFDLWEIAARACGDSVTIDHCSARLTASLRNVLETAARSQDVHVAVIVAGLDNGAPALEHITIAGTRGGRLTVSSTPYRRGMTRSTRIILGYRNAIDRFERATASSNSTLEAEASSLVRVEEGAAPGEVGGTVSTLTIQPSGERWAHPGCCPASCRK
jgi:hypothetical protein